jgi:hypothetical protein
MFIPIRLFGYISLRKLQVRFSLSSSPIFSRTDLSTDSERFYSSILDLFEDPDEREEVNDLTAWWNRSVNTCFVCKLIQISGLI